MLTKNQLTTIILIAVCVWGVLLLSQGIPVSASWLLSAALTSAADGMFTVTGVYRNEPRMSVRDRSAMHHGAILLQITGNPPTALRGTYWTDRMSAGDIELTGCQFSE